MVKLINICLFFILSTVYCQNVEDYLHTWNEIIKNMSSFEYPEKYYNFSDDQLNDGGIFGYYDFIIVGGGSAGTVLARRLSEVPRWRILLLEAGANETYFTDTPGAAVLIQYTNVNYAFRSTPQKFACQGMENKSCIIPRGRVLGGSSTTNFMMYARGNWHDCQKLTDEGLYTWNPDVCLQYYLKSENASMTDTVDYHYHNKSGPLHVEHVRYFSEFGQTFLDAAEELGRNILDYNAESQIGYSKLQSNTVNGRRSSGNKAFLSPVIGRKNLVVLTGAFVTKLIIVPKTNTVLGVQFILNNKTYSAIANKEVIMSAGVIGSPQILMLSGIGPKEHLEEIGIKIVQDLQGVGKNLWDHFFLPFPVATNYTEIDFKPVSDMISDYLQGKGYFTAAGNIPALGFLNTKNLSSPYPNIEQFVIPYISSKFLSSFFSWTNETAHSYFKLFPDNVNVFLVILLHPKSRGSITLRSKHFFDYPNIDFNYFSDPEDVEVLVSGIKDVIKIIQTDAMKKYNVTIQYNPLSYCGNYTYLSDDYLKCLVTHLATSLYHLAGTCKMGTFSDPKSVVTEDFKVKGIKKLRIIDASVLPFPFSGHTNAPTYMFAERGADIIKKQYFEI